MNTTARISFIILSSFLSFLILQKPQAALAATSVRVSSEGSSHVSVINTTQSSSSTVTSNNGKTDIVIECNGVKKEYHSDQPGNVNINCNEDSQEITVTKASLTTPDKPTLNQTTKEELDEEKEELKEKQEELTKKAEDAKEKAEKEQKDLLERIRDFLKDLFSFHL